jgi:RNA polymerase sigma factor (sigma-70 family)
MVGGLDPKMARDSTEAVSVSDLDLRDLVLSDPDRGWVALWERYGGIIRSRVFRFDLPEEDLLDLQQEVTIRFFEKDSEILRNWDPDRSALPVYLSVITTYTCHDYLRSKFHSYSKRKVSTPSDDDDQDFFAKLEDDRLSPAEKLNRQQVSDAIHHCLEEWAKDGPLKEKDRLLLELRVRGLSYKEVAEALGISEHNALVRFNRLKPRFRERLLKAGVFPGNGVG